MARLTPLDLPAAQALGRNYGLAVQRVELLVEGSVNSNFRVTTATGGRYFGRIFEEQPASGARFELELLTELGRAGVAVPVPLRRLQSHPQLGEWLSEHAGKPVAFYPWVIGESLCQARVTVLHTRCLGRVLAQIHETGRGLSAIPEGRFGPTSLLERIARIERQRADLRPLAAELRQQLAHYAARRRPDLPSGLIHADLFRDNALWVADAAPPRLAALLDFESACRGSYLFDLLVCVSAWCYSDRFDTALAAALLEGYESVRPLEPLERASHQVEAALVALRFAITRVTDFTMRCGPGETPARDYRRFLARLRGVEQGALQVVFDPEKRYTPGQP